MVSAGFYRSWTDPSLSDMFGPLLRYWHTVRHLRPVQVFGRVWHRVSRPRPDLSSPPPRRRPVGEFVTPVRRPRSLVGPNRFRLLNREGVVETKGDWNDPDKPKLWLYHLHYFDDLVARRAETRSDRHRELLRRWVSENPPGRGVGWEPYPTSIRIVNWVKWSLLKEGRRLGGALQHSLAVQVRWLRSWLEYHLLGNHLLANATALVVAGLFFEGEEADRWYERGRRLLSRELEEQITGDGGHFERSPMYHVGVLEDLLDIVNLHRCYARNVPAAVTETAEAMLRWMQVMRHPDGGIPFFNDAAAGMFASPRQVDAYADRLNLESRDPRKGVGRVRDLPETGYVRFEAGPAVGFLDAAPVGPDYLPAHAHADTLSFELSLWGQRIFVNTGTSEYGEGNRRQWERSTAAHNTLMVDGEDSSEVWGSFRVARRARITERSVEAERHPARVTAAHDGYVRLAGGAVHLRRWTIDNEGLEVVDQVTGEGTHDVEIGLHVHPAWTVRDLVEEGAVIVREGDEHRCRIRIEGSGSLELEENLYAPEFGRLETMETLRYRIPGRRLPLEIRVRIIWGPGPRTGT